MESIYELPVDDEMRRRGGGRAGAQAPRRAMPAAPRPTRPAPLVRRHAGAAPRCNCPQHGDRLIAWLQAALEQARAGADVETADTEDDTGEELEFFEQPFELETAYAPAAVDRSSATYIRWVQGALNRLQGSGLAVDGISGPMTRSAVRDFQTRQHLAVDGIVGPQTEAALVRAGAGQPPGGAAAPAPTPRRGRRGGRKSPPPSAGDRTFPTSSDGTPLFMQGDPEWGGETMGRDDTIKQSGCAISSMAMAISKIARRIYTPLDVDRWIDAHGGYGGTGGDEIKDWNVIAQIAGLGAERKSDNSLPTINRELDRGRPVVLGVDKTGDDVPDHWIALTRRGSESGQTVYYANDPATGLVIRMLLQGQEIVYDSRNYRSTGDYTIITGG